MFFYLPFVIYTCIINWIYNYLRNTIGVWADRESAATGRGTGTAGNRAGQTAAALSPALPYSRLRSGISISIGFWRRYCITRRV